MTCLYRESHIWYCYNLPQILAKFSDVFSQNMTKILIMPSFAPPDFERDGVHLTTYSGLFDLLFVCFSF